MGQAKKRGTFEERVGKAQLRNRLLLGLIRQTKNTGLGTLVATHGIQRVAVSLVNTGQLENLAHAAQTAQESSPHIITPAGNDDRRRIIPARLRPISPDV